jgi:hypothetical protein
MNAKGQPRRARADLALWSSAPGRIRTRDRLLRRQLLCPAELRAPEGNCVRRRSRDGYARVAVCRAFETVPPREIASRQPRGLPSVRGYLNLPSAMEPGEPDQLPNRVCDDPIDQLRIEACPAIAREPGRGHAISLHREQIPGPAEPVQVAEVHEPASVEPVAVPRKPPNAGAAACTGRDARSDSLAVLWPLANLRPRLGREILVRQAHCGGAVTDGGSDPLNRTVAGVSGRENARYGRLQRERRTVERPA